MIIGNRVVGRLAIPTIWPTRPILHLARMPGKLHGARSPWQAQSRLATGTSGLVRLRWTRRVAMSVGLIPLIRPAWPNERGRTLVELLAGLGAKLGNPQDNRGRPATAYLRAGGTARPAGPGGRCNRHIWPQWSPARRLEGSSDSLEQRGVERDQLLPGGRRAAEDLREGVAADAGRLQFEPQPLDPPPTGLEPRPSRRRRPGRSSGPWGSGGGRRCRSGAGGDIRPGW